MQRILIFSLFIFFTLVMGAACDRASPSGPTSLVPVISDVAVSAIATSSAEISWTTDRKTDSQVEYGLTTLYGTTSPPDATPVTSHVVKIDGLTQSTSYHFRVRSRDQAGNLAVSEDFTFTTLTDNVPTISLTSPTEGATVSGTITVSATVDGDVDVVGVQFFLDGANLGAEDTTSPYSVTWHTTTAVNGAHTLTAVARDAAGNRATSSGVVVTVSNLNSSRWPNEPAGLRVSTDWGFDQAVPTSGDVSIPGSPGWRVVYEVPPGQARGWAERVSVPGAPFSPPSAYDFVFPQGMVEGHAPATVYYNLSAAEVYAGFWWKPSAPFDLGPNGNKIAFLFNGGGGAGGQQFLILLPDGRLHVLPEYPGDFRWRHPNVNATAVTLGVWHRVEWYCQLQTRTLKWWLDGVLQGSHTDVRNSFIFDMFQFSPTWGGNSGARKRQTDHYWFDHVHLSVR